MTLNTIEAIAVAGTVIIGGTYLGIAYCIHKMNKTNKILYNELMKLREEKNEMDMQREYEEAFIPFG